MKKTALLCLPWLLAACSTPVPHYVEPPASAHATTFKGVDGASVQTYNRKGCLLTRTDLGDTETVRVFPGRKLYVEYTKPIGHGAMCHYLMTFVPQKGMHYALRGGLYRADDDMARFNNGRLSCAPKIVRVDAKGLMALVDADNEADRIPAPECRRP